MLQILRNFFLLFFVVAVLFMGCSDSAETTDPSTTVEDIESIYEYNDDETAVRTLSHSEVNIYEEVEADLAIVATDAEAYNGLLDKFMLLLMEGSQTLDKVSSYAPRGEDKSHIYKVTNGSLDYSNYTVRGDVTQDYKVDMDDIDALKDILYSKAQDLDYDVNGDDSVDILDFVDVVARLNIHVAYFDFYNTDGVKLPIEIRSIDDAKAIDISDEIMALITDDNIMVVTKDINKVSSYEIGLSDINDAWYNKDGWEYESSEIIPTLSSSRGPKKVDAYNGVDTLDVFIENSLSELTQLNVRPYLIGWDLIINMLETGGFDVPLPSVDRFSLLTTNASKDVRNHFLKTDMGYPGVADISKERFSYSIGLIQDGHNQIATKRESYRYSYVRKVDGVIVEKIKLYSAVTVASLLYGSEAKNTITGQIEGDEPFKGKVILKRVGPDPKEEEFEVQVNDNSFESNGLPLGGYDFDAVTECGCRVNLKTDVVFEVSSDSVSLVNPLEKAGKVYLSLVILDKDDKKVENADVKIVSQECSAEEFTEEKTTDTNGNVEFTGLDIGSYKVYVNAKEEATFQVCSNTNEVIKLEDLLWKFHVAFRNVYGSGSMSIKNFPMNLDGFNNPDNFSAVVFVGNDYQTYEEGTTISYGTLIYDSGNTPLSVSYYNNKHYADWSALQHVAVTGDPNYYMDVGAMWHGYPGVSSSTHCDSEILPTEFQSNVEEGIETKWTSVGTGAICDFTFSPCTDSECSD